MDKEIYHLNWSQYSWRDFEKICFEYIKECYSAKFYKTTLTRANKDQGRDIIIKGRKSRFEAWGECKDHKRNINLSVIGKNIVLALSHQINEAIFFSVSLVTLNTKIEILNVARLHGFEVLFLDGNELNKAILSCSKVSRKYFREEYEKYIKENSNPLWIDTYLSEYPFAEDAKNNSKQQYHLENGFQVFMHIFIKNAGNENVSELRIAFDDSPSQDIIFYDKSFFRDTLFNAHTDFLYTFQGLVFSPKKDIKIPSIKLIYRMQNGEYVQEKIEPGTIDASDIWKAPYVNSDSAEFMHNAINTLGNVIPKKYVRVLFIYGQSGMGKSRLMGEIENKAYELSYKVIHIDFRESPETQAMCDLLYALLGLPTTKHKIILSFSDFQITFKNKISDRFVPVLYSFLYKENTKGLYHRLADAIIELLTFSSEQESLLLGIDNIQELSPDLQVLFWNVVNRCKNLSIPVCFLFSQNTERFHDNDNVLVKYLNLCGDERENYIIPYKCGFLKQADAVVLMRQLLHLSQENEQWIMSFLKEDEVSPMDILLLSKSLSQTDGLFSRIGEFQYIKNPTVFSEKIAIISASPDAIIENRLYNLQRVIGCPMDIFLDLFSLIIFFDGNLPMEIFEKCEFNRGMLDLSNKNLLTKINYSENNICFYHERIFVYWSDRQIGVSPQKLKMIHTYYAENLDDNIVNSYFFLKTLVALKKSSEAVNKGLAILEKYRRENQNIYVQKTSDILLQVLNKTQNPIEYFRVLFQKADFLLERVNISEAENAFEEAKEIVSLKYTLFTEKDVVHFFHKYINQKLHTLQYAKALDALQEFEKINSTRSDAQLIINDRYCVALYSLGQETEALEKIDKVIETAKENKDNIWLSIAYSDKAFTYYFNSRNAEQIHINFSNAIKYYYLHNDADDISRTIEIYIQETLIHILEKNDNLAMESIQKAVLIAEEVDYGYLRIPAVNINAYLLLKKGNINNALLLLQKLLSLANIFSNAKALISIYNNFGNIYLLKNKQKEAIEYYQAGFSILQEICLPENSTRYIGLLCNMIKAYTACEEQQSVSNILGIYNFPILKEYAKQCQKSVNVKAGLLAFHYGILGYKGYDYLF